MKRPKKIEPAQQKKASLLQRCLHGYNTLFDLIAALGAIFAAAILIFMTLMICYSVIMRYFFRMPLGWSNEIAEYALLYITFLGATWLLKKDGHVRVDLLLNSVGEVWRALLNAWTSLLAIAICLLITYHGTLSTIEHYQRGIPVIQSLVIAKYLLLLIIPVGTFMLLLQFINDFVFYATQFILQLKQKLSIKQEAKP